MTIRDRENQLFRNWYRSVSIKEGQQFVIDGLVDEEEWKDTPFNVLYLSDQPVGITDDECEYLYLYDSTYTHKHSEKIDRLIQWMQIILHGAVQASISEEHKRWLLRQIAVVNMDKISGSEESDRRVNSIIGRLFLREQLALYSADLVLCDGTVEALRKLDTKYAANKWKRTAGGMDYLRIGRTIYLGSHPDEYAFAQALHEIDQLEKMKWEGRRGLPL